MIHTCIYIIMCMLALSILSYAQKAGDIINVKPHEVASFFKSMEIPDDVFSKIQDKSFPKECTTKRSDLCYLRVLHYNYDGKTQIGELVCNKTIASDLLSIFRKLYDVRYPIERMLLIDNYDADDEKSMSANNTSCFNFRFITGSTTKVSKHGLGLAIDINPLYNPYIKGNKVEPKAGKPYSTHREALSKKRKDIITPSSLPYRLFKKHGFHWGGEWKNLKDYQHFEK